MVYHDQNRIIFMGCGKVGNKIHGDLLERVGALGGDRGKQGAGRVGINLVCMVGGTASNEFLDEDSHARPPVVLLEEGNSAEVPAMGAY